VEQLNPTLSEAASRRRRSGVTLVEVMIATVLLSFGLLAMLALQLHAMRGGQRGRHYTQAAQIARDRMELLYRTPWADASVQPTGWTAPVAVTNAVDLDAGATAQEQAFNVDWRITANGADLRQFDVRVTWYEPNDPPPPNPPIRRYAITSLRFNDGT
jgi:type IV pilus modification protein PilV